MPSPFPGMDPYIEILNLWQDFHQRLASGITDALNQSLLAPGRSTYYALMEVRAEVGIVEDGDRHRIVVGVAVGRRPPALETEGAVAVAEPIVEEFSPSVEIEITGETIRHVFIEIRDSAREHKLVTLIEILSPSNKRRGPDRKAYQRKQTEVLESDASLVEIDLLRGGDRVLSHVDLEAGIDAIEPRPDYVVLVHRAWRRESCQVFPGRLRDRLPRVPIPLREGEPEVPLDLQVIFDRLYDISPYRVIIDYETPLAPLWPAEDASWAEALWKRNPA